jgi:hypothetical protein
VVAGAAGPYRCAGQIGLAAHGLAMALPASSRARPAGRANKDKSKAEPTRDAAEIVASADQAGAIAVSARCLGAGCGSAVPPAIPRAAVATAKCAAARS